MLSSVYWGNMYLKYRPEIDGLRAVSIIAVVFYHAELVFQGVMPFKGGFLGVDIFFVISGYLITSIILRQMNKGLFSFASFYERRARRILPALLTVIIASIPFSWLYMVPKAVVEYAGSILSILVFGSNVWFLLEDSYWAEPSSLKPFLHTWTLSVEEQFYIIFPIVLLLLWRFCRRYITIIFLLIFVLSLLLANYGSANYAEATFFLLPTRAWELLAGAILAKLELEKGRGNHPFLATVMPAFGLFLICYSIVIIDDGVKHPSFITLLPVFGAMLLIWFSKKGELVTDLLGSKPFVSLGLISYGLYLWHYPIFAFSKITSTFVSQEDRVMLIALSIMFSTVTYFLIEKPVRDINLVSTKTFLVSISIGVLLVISPMVYVYTYDGLWGRYQAWQLEYLQTASNATKSFSNYVDTEYSKLIGNEFSQDANKKRLLVIGDSFAKDFFNVLKEGDFIDEVEVSTHHIPPRCRNAPSMSPYIEYIKPKYVEECKRIVRIGDAALNDRIKEADFIIVASLWNDFTTKEMKNLQLELKNISEKELLIVGIKGFYVLKPDDVVELSEDEISTLRVSSQSVLLNDRVQLARQVMSGENDYLDLHSIICGDSFKCPVVTPDGHLISHDGDHLTKDGALYVSTLLKRNSQFMTKWNSVFMK